MLRANGGDAPVGDRFEVRAGVAIFGGGLAGAVAAEVIRQQEPGLTVVVLEGHPVPRSDLGANPHRIERLHLTDGRTVVADWYVDTGDSASERTHAENWIDCGGFGDANPSATQAIARDAGWAVVALHKGEHDRSWLLWSFYETKRRSLNELKRRSSGQPPEIQRHNIVKPNLVGAQRGTIAGFQNGPINPVPCYTRDSKALPITGVFAQLLEALKRHTVIADVLVELQQPGHPSLETCIDALEGMLQDGWLIGKLDGRRPMPVWPSNAKPSVTISTRTQSGEQIRK